LRADDSIYRIFYYDSAPLKDKGHNPITKEFIDFGKTAGARRQRELHDSIRSTPNFALRLGQTQWKGKGWVLKPKKFKALMNKKISIDELTGDDVFPHIVQKAVDMKIDLDIALIATKKLADLLIIIIGDADIVPALKFARREGMIVGLDPLWSPIRPELAEHVDFIDTKVPSPEPPKQMKFPLKQ
jgi:uncharacterized LabA/DUF88 family protein